MYKYIHNGQPPRYHYSKRGKFADVLLFYKIDLFFTKLSMPKYDAAFRSQNYIVSLFGWICSGLTTRRGAMSFWERWGGAGRDQNQPPPAHYVFVMPPRPGPSRTWPNDWRHPRSSPAWPRGRPAGSCDRDAPFKGSVWQEGRSQDFSVFFLAILWGFIKCI